MTENIETIFNKYKNRVYRLALSITRNERDAEDITQNTFLKIMKNLQYFRHKALLSTWIYRIAFNESLMYLRKRASHFKISSYLSKPQAKLDSGLFVNWSKLPDEQLLDNEFKERMDNAIRFLPIKYRMPLLLENVERLPLKDNAKILGININSLKTRLHRSRLIIKSEIVDYFRDKEEKPEKQDRKCAIWMGFIYNYAKGNLGKRKQNTFKKHIKDCLSCKSFLNTYTKAIRITKALECQDLPNELRNKIETFLASKHLKLKKKLPKNQYLWGG